MITKSSVIRHLPGEPPLLHSWRVYWLLWVGAVTFYVP